MNAGERAHLDAWKAAVAAATSCPAYEEDDDQAPAEMPSLYTLISVVRQFGPGTPRSTGQRAVTGWRLVTLFVGTTNREVLSLLERFTAAHEDTPLAVLNTTPLELETPADPPEAAAQDRRREAEVLWTYCT